jgi:3-hydroxyisobutyrate dehydrogenase
MNKQIGIVGVGNMGGGMAARLLDRGWQVRACDLVAERVDVLVAQGARGAARRQDAPQAPPP